MASIDNVAISLPTLGVSDDDKDLIKFHLDRLAQYEQHNKVREAYFEGKQKLKNLGISIPPALADIETVVGWPGTTVEVLEERLDWQGWVSDSGDLFGLDEVYLDNGLDVDSALGQLDALIYGTGFIIVGTGYTGEPSPLITVESPRRVTGLWDARIRRLSSALSVDEIATNTKAASVVTLYKPEGDITLSRESGEWKVVDRNDHELGRTMVAQLVNRPRASALGGRSEISKAIMSYTDQAVRTLLGMEVNREFYSAPQRYLLGADESSFKDQNGNQRTGWEAVMGRMLAIPRDEDGELPTIGQFTASSPAPYLEQVRGLSQLVSAEAAIPSSYLGFISDNPTSADAIRQAEARLIKRAERRQMIFGRAWREVGALALLTRDGAIPDDYRSVGVKWRDAATPTRSAAADEAVKLIGAGVLPADSTVTYDRIGLSPQEQRQIASDKRKANAQSRLTALASAAQAARATNPAVAGMEGAPSGDPGTPSGLPTGPA